MTDTRRRRSEQHKVHIIVDILENNIFKKYNSRKKISHHNIHKQPNNKYFKVFLKVSEYLEGLKCGYKNDIRWLISDYLTSVYGYYKRNLRKEPYLTQISPSTANQIRFEEFISKYTRENKEDYWVRDEFKEPDIFDVEIHPTDLPDIIEL